MLFWTMIWFDLDLGLVWYESLRFLGIAARMQKAAAAASLSMPPSQFQLDLNTR